MRVDANLPINIARAYGVPSAPRAAAPQVATPDQGGTTPTLVAGRVTQAVDPNLGASPASPASLPMYTRAADRVEAATAIQLGRSIDVVG